MVKSCYLGMTVTVSKLHSQQSEEENKLKECLLPLSSESVTEKVP
jgi:hypothetical protein